MHVLAVTFLVIVVAFCDANKLPEVGLEVVRIVNKNTDECILKKVTNYCYCTITQKLTKEQNYIDTLKFQDDLIEHYGYPLETHQTITEDGYVLSIHRISPTNPENGYRGVVFLMPGLFGSSSAYVLNGKEKSMAFRLANLGYDTWIANPRGTTHSRKHLTLDPDDEKSEFWDFRYICILRFDTFSTDFCITLFGTYYCF